MNKKNICLSVLAMAALTACKPHLDTEAPTAGSLDLSSYVAVGNSLTAGYADNSLYRSGQENSYPNILATQFKTVGGGAFKIPYLDNESGYPGPKFILDYKTDCTGATSLSPVPAAYDPNGSTSIAADGPYNNTGVPGIRAIDYLIPGYPALNPYSARFFTNLTGTPLEEINRAHATFFTAWVGNNDVLGYATSGGIGKGSNGSFADQNSVSSPILFSVAIDSVVNRMTANGAKGALINIPDVTAIPYFTTIKPGDLKLTDVQAGQLNTAYAGTGISFTSGSNNFVIQDTTVPVLKFRLIRSDEFLLLTLPQDSLKCAGWGTTKPIPSQYVLDHTETDNVRTATATFNGIIKQAAAAHGLAYVDINSYLKTIQSGIEFNGVNYNAVFVSGGAFSLDGVHLTPRGYALAANEIIRTINSFYGATIPYADVNKYPGIKFP